MKKIFLSFSLIMISHFVIADDVEPTCGAQGSEVVLDYQVQDQDGLGTCYANAAALLVQNTAKTTDPVSYQQLAMATATEVKSKKDLIGDNEKLVFEAGKLCSSFMVAKKNGWCSARSFDSFEHHGSNDSNLNQAFVMRAIAKFINEQTSTGDGQKIDATKLGLELQELIKIRQNECLENSKDDLFLKYFNQKAVEVVKKRIADLKTLDCKKSKCDLTVSERDTWILKLTEFLNRSTEIKVNNSIMKDGVVTQFKSDFVENIKNMKTEGKSWGLATSDLISNRITPPNGAIFNFFTVMGVGKNVIGELATPFDQAVADALVVTNSCNTNWSFADLLSKVDLDKLNETVICSDSRKIHPNDQLDFLDSQAKLLSKKLSEGILKKNKLKVIQDILAPGCAAEMEKNKDVLKNKTCTTYKMTHLHPNFNELGENKFITNIKPNKVKNEALKKVLNQLCKKSVVGISTCAEFLYEKQNKETNFCKKKLKGVKKHFFHAMALVGFRQLPNGKTDILVQNSWGQSCKQLEFPGKDLKCEMKEGKPTGRIWIDSDLLLGNTYQLGVVEDI